MGIPRPASRHYAETEALSALAKAEGRRAWARLEPRFLSSSWMVILASLAPALADLQRRAAVGGADYVAPTMAAQGVYEAPAGFVIADAFAGWSSNGTLLAQELYTPIIDTKRALAQGFSLAAALAQGRASLDRITQTEVAAAGRQAASVDIATRPHTGWTRMVSAGACGRCIMLAGKFFRWNKGFKRHPSCHCVHIPTTEAVEGDVRTDPYDYFYSLTESEQDKAFGKANAQAIRDGADIYQVGNAWRGAKGGMTTEGTTRRGYSASLKGRRLTPQAIYDQATSREEALRMLARHHYILPSGQASGGLIRGDDPSWYGAMGRGGTRKAASAAVERAIRTGERDPNSIYTMTAAERRLYDARTAYETALAGRNPFGRGPVTPTALATAERNYRRWLATGGNVY